MQYRLIALDVDGTLINDQFQIMPKTKHILRDAYEQGIMIALCTGRGTESTIPLMEELGVEGPVVVHNGAIVLHSRTREIYGQVGMRIEELGGIIDYCRTNGIHMDVSTAFDLYVESVTPEMESLYLEYYARPIIVPNVSELDEEIVRMSILTEIAEVDRIYAELKDRFPQFRITQSGENYIDIIHPAVSKGEGTSRLVKKLGLHLEEVIAFGNYYNDLELLASVGLGIAMENSPEEVKQVAKAVTRSNNDEGIYHALKKYLYK